jgi:hypothetical protein
MNRISATEEYNDRERDEEGVGRKGEIRQG